MKFDEIVERLDTLMKTETEENIKEELGTPYVKLVADISRIKGKI